VKVRLAYGTKVDYAPQIIALREGYFQEQGLEVEALALQAGRQCAEALTTGNADIAVMGDVPAILAACAALPTKIVASYGNTVHRMVAAKDSGIKQPKDLEGKRLAVQKGSSTYGGFLLWCKKNGVDINKVKVLDLDPTTMPEAMIARQIDVMVGSEPWPSNVEEKCPGAYTVAELSGLGNTFPLVVMVTAEFAEKQPEAVVGFLRAVSKAVDMLREDPDRAAAIIASVTGVPVEREAKSVRKYGWGMRMDEELRASLEQTAEFLKEQGKIKALPDFAKVLNDWFMNRL